jgi:hypothetical protein
MRSTSSKSILFLSDMHVGSYNAVCSPNPQIKDTEIKPTKLQEKLYNQWVKVKDSLQNKNLFCICVNGEPIDGANSKQVGLDAWTTDINLQIDDAVKLLKEFKTKYFVLTRGSGYHTTKEATNYEEDVAKELNAVPYSTYGNLGKITYKLDNWDENRNKSTRTDHHLTMKVADKVFSITHHIGFTRWFNYQPMAISREAANLEYLRGKYWTPENYPTFIVRSHVHYYCQVRFSSTVAFTTPSWKFPDSFLYRGGLAGTAPSIGGIEVILEPNGHYLVEPYILHNDDYPKMEVLELK